MCQSRRRPASTTGAGHAQRGSGAAADTFSFAAAAWGSGVWPDNETEIDLLGFEYLVDSLEVVLSEPRLLPVTVGVMGDWGSGKSSLMSMTARRLDRRDGYIVVPFSPWRYEGHDDVKTALMANVLERLVARAHDDPSRWQRVKELLPPLALDLRSLARAAPALGAAGAVALGAPPETGTLAGTAAAEMLATTFDEAARDETDGQPPRPVSASGFRGHFKALLDELDDVEAIVVVVDDLDRCLPETIVSTLETIKLFLHVPRTAYVLAAHPLIVEAAVAARYAGNRDGDANLGRDYLEKIVQVTITVPPLAEPEVESYINLLFAELSLDGDAFAAVRAEANARRVREQLAVAMDYAAAQRALDGNVPNELQRSFELANRIAPVLARGLRGNPRQIKRFLNALILRLKTAERRGVTLDPAVLAKLMVLELSLPDFERVFRWQLAQDGQPVELAQAETVARGGPAPDGTEESTMTWANTPEIAAWLRLEPPLARVPLGRYFFFARDRLSPAAPAARLPAALQELLGDLQDTVAVRRRAAAQRATDVGTEQLAPLVAALADRAVRDPRGAAMRSLLEIVASRPEFSAQLADALRRIPPAGVPPSLPPALTVALRPIPAEIGAVLTEWHGGGSRRLRAAVEEARKER